MGSAAVGSIIGGRYIVEGVLGRGGMGEVLRARHTFTKAPVALKLLHPELQLDETMQHRFISEARASSAIGHPGIVTVFDGGRTPENTLYLAMELLEGRTLRRALATQMPPEIMQRIVLELLDALGAAHAARIVHRDLKPENVFLCDPHGKAKLLDFGIAKVAETASRAGGITAAGAMLGTLLYMAPEQLMDASTVDHRVDLWAVGVMMYEMISGKLPFRGATASEIMVALTVEEPTPIGNYVAVDPQVEAFFKRALARERQHRFSSAREMAAAVTALTGRWLASTPSAQQPIAAPYTAMTGPGTAMTGPGTGMTGPGTMPTGGAPSTGAPAYPPTMSTGAPYPTTGAPFVSAATTFSTAPKKSRAWLAIPIAVVVTTIVVIVVLAQGRSSTPVVPPPADATMLIVDATIVLPVDAAAPDTVNECALRCAAVQTCGYTPQSECERLCNLNDQVRACIATSDCFDASRCYVGLGCPSKPSGAKTCFQTLQCLAKDSSPDAACACFAAAAPQHATLIGQITFCTYGCTHTANKDACLKAKCEPIIKTCAKR